MQVTDLLVFLLVQSFFSLPLIYLIDGFLLIYHPVS
jgi:hypothetical protein